MGSSRRGRADEKRAKRFLKSLSPTAPRVTVDGDEYIRDDQGNWHGPMGTLLRVTPEAKRIEKEWKQKQPSPPRPA